MSLISRNNTISHYLKCIWLSSFKSPQVLVFSSASSMMNLYICIENRQTWKLDQQGIWGGGHGCPWVLIGLPSVFIQGVRNSHKSTDPREMPLLPLPRTTSLPSFWQTTHASGAPRTGTICREQATTNFAKTIPLWRQQEAYATP